MPELRILPFTLQMCQEAVSWNNEGVRVCREGAGGGGGWHQLGTLARLRYAFLMVALSLPMGTSSAS